MAKGVGYLREALDRDPGFALAWAELAKTFAKEADMGWVPVSDGYGRAREAVERALAMEPDLAEAHAQMGRMRMLHDRDWRGAEASFAKALAITPGNAMALSGAGALAMNSGRLDEAIELTRRSLEGDPLSASAYMSLGMSLFAADRFAQAEEAFRKALELAPQRGATHAHLALALVAQGQGEEALEEAAREPHEGFRLWAHAMIHHLVGQRKESDAALGRLTGEFADGGAYQIAEVFGTRGESDAAFEWLGRARAMHDGGLAEMKASPRLRSLHADPRWHTFLKEMGFEP
jgi:tetratricopeptide (TPR) repeat protein